MHSRDATVDYGDNLQLFEASLWALNTNDRGIVATCTLQAASIPHSAIRSGPRSWAFAAIPLLPFNVTVERSGSKSVIRDDVMKRCVLEWETL